MGWLPVRGSFGALRGLVHVDQLGAATGELTIPAETIKTGIKMRDRDLRGKKFFAVDRYPHISFTLESLTPAPDGEVSITGTLTIRERTQPVTIRATIVQVGEDEVRLEADLTSTTAARALTRRAFLAQ